MKRSTALALALASGAATSMGLVYALPPAQHPAQQNCYPNNGQSASNGQQAANCSRSTSTTRIPYFPGARGYGNQQDSDYNNRVANNSDYGNRPSNNRRTSWGGFGSSGRGFSGGFGG